LRGQGPVIGFYFFRFAMPFILFGVSFLYLNLINDFGLQGMQQLAVMMGLAVLGYYAPGIYLSNLAQKRRDSIMQAFPDSLDLLLICVEAGMSIEAAFQKVAAEIGSSSIELAEELSLTTAELSFLQDRRMAYENLAMRTNHPGVKSVATALVQAERYGTPLGQALRVMAKENRDMRMSAAEKKGGGLAGEADRADDPVLPAGAVPGHHRTCSHLLPKHVTRATTRASLGSCSAGSGRAALGVCHVWLRKSGRTPARGAADCWRVSG
jgi:tight adherence protein C